MSAIRAAKMQILYNPLPRDHHDHSFTFPFQCFMLKILGVWPLHPSVYEESHGWLQRALALLYLSWAYVVIAVVGMTCAAQAAYVFVAWGDILTVTDCGCTVLMGVQNWLRLIHLNTHRMKLSRLNEAFVRDVWISRRNNVAVAAQCEHDSRIYKIVSGMLFVLINLYVLVPLIELFSYPDLNDMPFPYKMTFPYNQNINPIYAITYVLTSLAGFFVISTLFSEDSIFGFFASHSCGRFRLLHLAIDELADERLNAGKRWTKWDGLRRGALWNDGGMKSRMMLSKIVRDHGVIIRFCDQLEDFFSPVLLLNFTISSMLICMTLFQLAAVKLTLANMAKLLIYFASALSQFFLLCWNGNKLMTKSVDTAEKLYECNWHINSPESANCVSADNDIAFTKDLSFAMLRAQKPICMTAMKFSVLSLKSFSAILSTSLSYFTLLQSLIEKEE